MFFDGQIKAPPSVGVHVVGFVEEIAMALRGGCWQLSQQYERIWHFLSRRIAILGVFLLS
jgi:hypothetical protein